MADLGVKPPVVAVTVMPVLCIILQSVGEGVRALDDKEHTGDLRKPFFNQEGQTPREEVTAELPQKRSGNFHR